MEFNYTETDHLPPLTFTPPPPPINFSCIPHQHLPACHGGWGYNNGSYHLEGLNSAIEMSELMRWEMEKGKIREEIMMETAWRQLQKERIREEIIVDEIMTRRLLEAEVRRELSMEIDFAYQRGGDLFIGPRGVPAPLLHCELEGKPLGERFVTSLSGRLGMSSVLKREFGGLGTGLQMSAEPQNFEVKPHLGNGRQKEKIILPVRPLQDVNACVLSPVVSAKKQLKEEWSCALCHVTASSEQFLNEHLQGKRHQSKVAGLRKKGNKCNIGWYTAKTPLVSTKDASLVSSKVSNTSDQNIVKSPEPASQDPHNTKINDYLFDDSGKNSEAMVGERKKSPCTEEHHMKIKHHAQLQKSNQDTQVMHVSQELTVCKMDGADGQNSASEDLSYVPHMVDLEVQLEEEANIVVETSSQNPGHEIMMDYHMKGRKHLASLQKSNQNTQVMQARQELTVIKKDSENSGPEDSSAVYKVELEDQQKKEANVNAETSSDTPKRSCDTLITASQQLDDSARKSWTPIVRTQEHKKKLFRFWCEMCQIGTVTEKDIEIHRTGKKHLAHKKNLFRFWCDVCQIGTDTEKDMEIHRTAKKHLSQLQKINQNPSHEYLNYAKQPIQDADTNSVDTNKGCNLRMCKSQLSDVCMKKKEAPVWRMKETQGLMK